MRTRIVAVGFVGIALLAVGCRKAPPSEPADSTGQAKPSARVADPRSAVPNPLPLIPLRNTGLSVAEAKVAGQCANRGIEYLLSQQHKDGGWSLADSANEPAITALVLRVLMRHPAFSTRTAPVARGYERLLSFQQPDGGIYNPKEGYQNYTTAIAVCALAAAKDPKLKPALDKALGYLRGIQIVPGSESRDPEAPGAKIPPNSPYIGGVSYGKHGRPDLSNLGWWMEAMHDADVPDDDPAMRQALDFVLRCQNRSESNPMAFAQAGSNDGGFIYAPATRDTAISESKADAPGYKGPVYQSYGSISYVGLKSMLYAGLTKNDPRVKAVFTYLRRNWTLDRNPGMPKARDQQGLYFYYDVMARALQAFGENELPVGDGKVNWRAELVKALAERQKPNGSWVNEKAPRWDEGSPVLVTAYEVSALEDVLGK